MFRYTDKADLWGAGAILYEMLTGTPPIAVNSTMQLFEKIRGTVSISLPSNVPSTDLLRDLVRRMLTVDVDARISWEAFFDHPWITPAPMCRSGSFLKIDSSMFASGKTPTIQESECTAPEDKLASELEAGHWRVQALRGVADLRGHTPEGLYLLHWCFKVVRGSLLTAERRAAADPALKRSASTSGTRLRTAIDDLTATYGILQKAMSTVSKEIAASKLPPDYAVESPERDVYNRALALGRSAGVDEMMGRYDRAVSQYGTAASLLECIMQVLTDKADRDALIQLIGQFRERQTMTMRL
jgi:hypothetical protein